MSHDDDLVMRLARLDTCALSDALDRLGLSGCVSGLSPLSCRRRIAGRVHTVKLVAKKTPPSSAPARHLGTTAIAAAQPGDVIVVEQRTGIDAASWGGILSLGAKLRGVAGAIADGPVRDIDEAQGLDFPVFARGTTARTARHRIVEEAADVPVTIGEIVVHPGDYVVADSSAVVFVRPSDAPGVIEVAEAIAEREDGMAKALLAGKPIVEVMGAEYERMLEGR